jgi:hypothetical protein
MADAARLRQEVGSLDQLIEEQAAALAAMLQSHGGDLPEAELRYPSSLNEMQKAEPARRALHLASSRLNELRWQREIKLEILRLMAAASS